MGIYKALPHKGRMSIKVYESGGGAIVVRLNVSHSRNPKPFSLLTHEDWNVISIEAKFGITVFSSVLMGCEALTLGGGANSEP